MKRVISAILAVLILCVTISGCGRKAPVNEVKNDGQKYNIAVISGGICDEKFESFFSGVYECFRNIGYSVDQFAAANDEEYLKSILNDSLGGGYIGVILYNLGDYADEYVIKAKEAGVFVSVFSENAYVHPNVSNICYDQEQMTKISVDELVNLYRTDATASKVIVKAWYDETNAVNAARSQTFDKYIAKNGLKAKVDIYEESLNEKSGLSRTTKSQLRDLPQTGMNYIWAADETMAQMIAEYLKFESINNAVVVNIGMSQKNIHKMYEYETYWHAASVVSYTASGRVCAETLSKNIEQKPVEQVIYIPTFMLYSRDLEENPNIEIVDEKANQ